MHTEVIVLAAGKGTRMRSAQPKVLHPLAGKPLLGHVLDVAASLAPARVRVVVGAGGEQVAAAFAGRSVEWVEQAEQLGTAHAVQMATQMQDAGLRRKARCRRLMTQPSL